MLNVTPHTGCGQCAAGYEPRSADVWAGGCRACPRGKVKFEAGSAPCRGCGVGRYQALAASDSAAVTCMACPGGKTTQGPDGGSSADDCVVESLARRSTLLHFPVPGFVASQPQARCYRLCSCSTPIPKVPTAHRLLAPRGSACDVHAHHHLCTTQGPSLVILHTAHQRPIDTGRLWSA